MLLVLYKILQGKDFFLNFAAIYALLYTNEVFHEHFACRSSNLDVDIFALLRGLVRDENDQIVSARTLMTKWFLHVNFTEVDLDQIGNSAGTENWVGTCFS